MSKGEGHVYMTGKTRLEVVYPNVKAWSWSPVLFEDVSALTDCIELSASVTSHSARILAGPLCLLLLLESALIQRRWNAR